MAKAKEQKMEKKSKSNFLDRKRNEIPNDNTKAVNSIAKKDKEISLFIENHENIKRNHYKIFKQKKKSF